MHVVIVVLARERSYVLLQSEIPTFDLRNITSKEEKPKTKPPARRLVKTATTRIRIFELEDGFLGLILISIFVLLSDD